MTAATARHNRIASPRITPEPPPLPATPAARQAAYADAVMAAVLTLQTQLRHPDAKIARDAAVAIIDLEKTRLRHGEPVAGTHAPSEVLEPLDRPRVFAATSGSGSRNPAPGGRGEEGSVNLADPFEVYVERVRQVQQSWEDEDGFDITISRTESRRYAVELIEKARRRKAGEAVPPPCDPLLEPPDALVDAESGGSVPLAPRVG